MRQSLVEGLRKLAICTRTASRSWSERISADSSETPAFHFDLPLLGAADRDYLRERAIVVSVMLHQRLTKVSSRAGRMCVPKTLSELMTRWKGLSWRNDRASVFRPGRLGRANQIEDEA